jgi:ABC-type molybdate transport system permease subunit
MIVAINALMGLPPVVVGLLVYLLLSRAGPLGHFGLLFSPTAMVIAQAILVTPIVAALSRQVIADAWSEYREQLRSLGASRRRAAATLRATPIDAFFSVAVPLARPGYLTAIVLGFAHTVGEFGVVLMIGGNIPGKTGVVSTQIYGHVEALQYRQAHVLAALMVAFSFAVLLFLQRARSAAAKDAP